VFAIGRTRLSLGVSAGSSATMASLRSDTLMQFITLKKLPTCNPPFQSRTLRDVGRHHWATGTCMVEPAHEWHVILVSEYSSGFLSPPGRCPLFLSPYVWS
jgi:hypothetical protein